MNGYLEIDACICCGDVAIILHLGEGEGWIIPYSEPEDIQLLIDKLQQAKSLMIGMRQHQANQAVDAAECLFKREP